MRSEVMGLLTWMPAFYERAYGWTPARIGKLWGIVTLVYSTIGLFVGARLTEVTPGQKEDETERAEE